MKTSFYNACGAAVAGAAVGALLMYMFDPDNGRRRRASARDKTLSTANDAIDAVESTARDVSNRARGTVHEVKGVLSPEKPGGVGAA